MVLARVENTIKGEEAQDPAGADFVGERAGQGHSDDALAPSHLWVPG